MEVRDDWRSRPGNEPAELIRMFFAGGCDREI